MSATIYSPAFTACVAVVLGYEGGYSDNPADPGGETNFGISKRSHPDVDIKALTVEGATAIYWSEYWNFVKGDALPPMLAMLVFDAAVNNNNHLAATWLQGLVGVGKDGDIGPVTLHAVTQAALRMTLRELCAEYLATRMRFMVALPEWHDFAGGWSVRLAEIGIDAVTVQYQLGAA